jgi:hypothetical protein
VKIYLKTFLFRTKRRKKRESFGKEKCLHILWHKWCWIHFRLHNVTEHLIALYHTLSCTLYFSKTYTHTHSHTLTHTLSHSSFLSLKHTHSLILILTHTLLLSLLLLVHTLTHTLIQTLTHKHTHTHTHTRTHTRSQAYFCSLFEPNFFESIFISHIIFLYFSTYIPSLQCIIPFCTFAHLNQKNSEKNLQLQQSICELWKIYSIFTIWVKKQI